MSNYEMEMNTREGFANLQFLFLKKWLRLLSGPFVRSARPAAALNYQFNVKTADTALQLARLLSETHG